MRRARESLLPMVLAGALLMGACSDSTDGQAEFEENGDPTPGPTDSPEEPPEDVAPEPVVAVTTLWQDGEEVEVEARVGPIVRDGELALLPMVFDVVSDTGSVDVRFDILRPPSLSHDPAQVRLVDPHEMTASQLAQRPRERGSDDHTHALRWLTRLTGTIARTNIEAGEEPVVWTGLYGAPEPDSIGVLMQHFGLVEDVPVVDEYEGLPELDLEVDEGDDPIVWPTVDELAGDVWEINRNQIVPRVFPVESYRERIDVPVGTHGEEDQATVTIATDVLFDPDEHELTGEADTALQAAADELAGVEGGDLRIVGHTDDVHGQVDNQELSENRAEAVRERLADLADLSVFEDVVTEGRAYDEPVASNDSEEGRALNRRVELHFTPPPEPVEPEEVEEVELPDTEGPSGPHPEGVEVESRTGEGRAHITIDSVRRVGRVYVGQITVEQVTPNIGDEGTLHWPLAGGASGPRGVGFRPWEQFTTDAPTLLAGGQRIFPLDYFVHPIGAEEDDEDAVLVPLTDRDFTSSHAPGESRTATVLWPAIGADTVTVDVPSETESGGLWQSAALDPWRITDVPVE